MDENNNNEHFKVLSNELTDIEQQLIFNNGYTIKQPINDTNTLETLNFLNKCHILIFVFKKDKNNK